jgi:carbonic anhydrase
MHNQDSDRCEIAACGCHEDEHASLALSRRRLLGATVAGAAVALVAGAGTELARPSAARAQTTMTPDEALKTLMDGNQRFVDGKMTSFEHDLRLLQQHTAEKQEPFAAVLACADSRVPVELIFDQTIGHVFVNRVAGNIATTEIIASLEYGAAVLGTKTIMVLGHGSCGAVAAAIASKPVPGQISSLYRALRPAVNEGGGQLDQCIADNAKIQAQLLRESSTVLAEMVGKGSLSVVAAVYDIATGKVTLLS